GYDQLRAFGDADQTLPDLALHHLVGQSLLVLGQAFFDAEDRVQAVRNAGTNLPVDDLVGDKVLPALAVAYDDVLTERRQHQRRDRAGVGTLPFPEDVLRPEEDRAPDEQPLA